MKSGKKGCLEFIKLAKENNLLNKIILNKVYWTAFLNQNEQFYNIEQVNKANKFLDKQYDFIEKFIGENNTIIYSKSLLLANKKHIWGLSPFHYVDELYLSMLLQLKDSNFRKIIKNQSNSKKNRIYETKKSKN